MFIEIYRIH